MAEEIRVAVEAGRAVGSRPSRRLRGEGKIPGVVYGHGVEPMPVAVDARALRAALTTDAGLNALLDLRVDGTSHLTLAREVQRHPVKGTVSHVDFVIVRRDEVVTSDVPIALTGEASEVHKGDGMVDQQLFSLSVQALPSAIPNQIEIDIGDLTIGQSIRVGEVALPDGVSTEVDTETTVVVGQPPQVSAADLVREGAEEEVAEGAEAEGAEAEGAEPAGEAAGGGAGERSGGGEPGGEEAGAS